MVTIPEKIHVLIPCAGSGSRAGTALPKQYTLLEGLPLVIHTVKAFAQVAGLSQCLLVVAPGDATLSGMLAQHGLGHWSVASVGGATRAQSVLAGLRHLQSQGASAADWVMVHDAARCLVEPAHIAHLMSACRADAVGGLLAQPLADTLKAERGGRVQATLDRSGKWLAQTPQMFRLGVLTEALNQAGDAVTDEASAMEHIGLAPLLVRGSAHNFKVTYPEDFQLARALLAARQANKEASA
jgi:2-C-methyl-D-erythritol 4-phosphate cytidylyltransferase